MRAISGFAVAIVTCGLLASPVSAERITIPLTGVQLLTNPDGRVRLVLPTSAPALTGNFSLGEAWLRLPGLPLSATRNLRIHVLAVRGPWAPGGEVPVHEGLVGRLSLPRGGAAQGIDLTNLMRGVLSGAALHGLLVTVPEGTGSGFEAADAPSLLAAFEQATLVISYRRIPAPPRAIP